VKKYEVKIATIDIVYNLEAYHKIYIAKCISSSKSQG